MILSIPFLASRLEQFSPTAVEAGFGVEASVFDRHDLIDTETWRCIRNNTQWIAREYSPSSYTFHFPVNDCNYVKDPVVRQRLWECLDLVEACKMDGMVLHSNLVYPTDDWVKLDVSRKRDEYLMFLEELRSRVAGRNLWIGLENMPIHGNDATELDPLLVYPRDFEGMVGGNIGVTWDFCHFSYSVHVSQLILSGAFGERDEYPRLQSARYHDFLALGDAIVHYHFSAFRGLASRRLGTKCIEGVAPWEGDLEEAVYSEAFALLCSTSVKAVTLEIREHDYCNRNAVQEVARWCSAILAGGQKGTQ